jgi:hypothetical protein
MLAHAFADESGNTEKDDEEAVIDSVLRTEFWWAPTANNRRLTG